MGMVAEQTKEWTELMSKQRKDNWEMIKAHRTAQEEILKKIMETAQVWPQIVLERKRIDNSNNRRLKNDQYFIILTKRLSN